MPSPIGHALAGLVVAWSADLVVAPSAVRRVSTTELRFVMFAAVLAAVAPDLDLLSESHRGWTHSIGAAVLAAVVAALWARRRAFSVSRTAVVVGLAWGTHVLLDWLGTDGSIPRGVMALWPFDTNYYFSPITIFPRVERRYWLGWSFIRAGLVALAFELVLLGGLAFVIWTLRQRSMRAVSRGSEYV